MSDDNTSLEDKLKAVFANPTTRSMVASALASPRPNGWGKHSKAPYFNKAYAEEMRKIVDQQIENRKDVVFVYEKWCKALGISERTLYARINQSIMFLLERLDPDNKYKHWYENVTIDCKKSQFAIIISLTKIEEQRALTPEFAEPRLTMAQWRKDMMDWLEDNDNQEPFIREGLCLSPAEILEMREQFLPNSGLMVDIKSNKISLVKV